MTSIAQAAEDALRLTKEALGGLTDEAQRLNKDLSVASGFSAYDLQAPAKELVPHFTPLRNVLPRISRTNPGDAARWRQITSITGSGFDSMGWVPEGARSARMSYGTTPKSLPYVSIGEEDSITFEAEAAAQGFENINATATLRLLRKMMRKEEMALMGGNASISLGTPASAPALGASGTSATLPGAPTTYSVIVAFLTFEGWKNASLANGVATTKVIIGADGEPYTLNGGVSNQSSATTQAITLGQSLTATVAGAPQGTVAYAWFVGTVGNETLQAITTINSAVFSAPLTASRQPATAITADFSTNASVAFDGLITIGSNSANSAYYRSLATGTAGAGTTLTASGRGSVIEIDDMLQQMFDLYRLSPSVIWVSSQQSRDITSKCLTNASGPLLRYTVDATNSGDYRGMRASGSIAWYYNPFSLDGGSDIPIRIHPDLPSGTIVGYCDKLPPEYVNANIDTPLGVLLQRDYYRMDWPLKSRKREFGVYSQEVLASYVPFGIGILTNIGAG